MPDEILKLLSAARQRSTALAEMTLDGTTVSDPRRAVIVRARGQGMFIDALVQPSPLYVSGAGGGRCDGPSSTRRWSEVVDLLEADPTDAARITGATVVAAEAHLKSLPRHDSLTYAFSLLLRIATAAQSKTFVRDVRRLGLTVSADTSAIELIGEVADEIGRRFQDTSGQGTTTELASLAVRRALTETVGSFGGSLFGSTGAARASRPTLRDRGAFRVKLGIGYSDARLG